MDSGIEDDLTLLLAEERSAVIIGDFAKLTALTPKKESLLEALVATNLPARKMAELAKNIDKNQTLLSAAMRGIEAAQNRMAILEKVRTGSNVYSRNGQVTQMTSENPTLKRKA